MLCNFRDIERHSVEIIVVTPLEVHSFSANLLHASDTLVNSMVLAGAFLLLLSHSNYLPICFPMSGRCPCTPVGGVLHSVEDITATRFRPIFGKCQPLSYDSGWFRFNAEKLLSSNTLSRVFFKSDPEILLRIL